MMDSPRLSTYPDRTLLSYGLRPSFIAGAMWAGLASPIWLPVVFGAVQITTAFTPVDWLLHEGLYGYLAAIITGFLLTVIPSWTGRPPLEGRLLAVLVLIWLAGRLAIAISATIGPVLAGGIDSLFLLLAVVVAGRAVIGACTWKSFPPIGLLIALFAGNVIFHIGAYGGGSSELGKRIGIAAAIMLVTLIGARVIPSLTHDKQAEDTPQRPAVRSRSLETAVSAVSGVALTMWIVLPDLPVTGALMVVAGAIHAVRLARWLCDRTVQSTLTLIQQIAYGFVPLGFLLLGRAGLFAPDEPVSADIRAWMVAATGIMTLAIVTRAGLDNTSHAPSARLMAGVIYTAVAIAVVARLSAGWSPALLPIGGAAWVVAFAVFAIGCGPLLANPGVDGGKAS
jgi:uncharacterized protein involved in response to NO